MAMITGVGISVVGILTAILSKFMVAEIDAWSPTIIRRLIQLAVAWLPVDQRERYSEEWQSHVNEVPGKLGKFLLAAGFLLAAHKMSLTFRHTELIESWWEIIARQEHSDAKLRMLLDEIKNDKAITSRKDAMSAVSDLSSYVSKSEECAGEVARSLSQLLENLAKLPTTVAFIFRLPIHYIIENPVQKKFVELSHQLEQREGHFASLIRLADERRRQLTLTAPPTNPMLDDAAEK